MNVPPAPGAERHPALDFANSRLALPAGRTAELLDSPAAATRWLVGWGLVPVDVQLQEVCAARLREFRAQVGELLAAVTAGRPAPANALLAVNAALSATSSAELLCWDQERGLHRRQVPPVDRILDHALAVLAADLAELLTGPDAERVAQCGSAPCRRFLVRTHASRHWCSVRCGDRARAARAYAKRSAAPLD